MNEAIDTRLRRPGSLEKNPRLSQWLRINREGTVSVFSGKVELGQGILTALAQIAAEELQLDPARIRMVSADTACSPDEGVTSGSLSIQDSGSALRRACAQARRILIERAAERLGAPPESLRAEDGTIRAGAKSVTYWELFEERLFDCEVDATAPVLAPADYRIVRRSLPRLDLPDKLAGRARFIQDMTLPGMLFGRVVRPPYRFAALEQVDESRARALQGVIAIVRDGGFLGVIAEREDVAVAAAKRLREDARFAPAVRLPADIHAFLREHAAENRVISEKSDPAASTRAAKRLSARYTRPYLAHASIGPSCAVAQWQGDALTVWTHSQGIYNLRRDLALALAMPERAIRVVHREGAGCYGHNGADDAALDAALLARAAGGRPVKLQWMREDEFAWEPFGPAMLIALDAALDRDGNVVEWRHELWSNGHSSRPGRGEHPALLAAWQRERAFPQPPAINMPLPPGGADRNAIPLYEFPNQRIVNHYVREMPLRTSALRSLGAHANVFAIESFMDELALAAGTDPIAFRLRHLKDERARAVIEAAVRASGWSQWKREEGRGHGIGFAKYKNLGAYCAVVAEVQAEREVRVPRLTVAVDVGLAVNPDGVKNQIEGGAIQATSWTLKEQVKLDERGVGSLGWEDYPILRFSEVPAVEVVLIERPELSPVGAGEAAQGPTTAAIANALYDALGARVRQLPLTPERIVEAIAAQA